MVDRVQLLDREALLVRLAAAATAAAAAAAAAATAAATAADLDAVGSHVDACVRIGGGGDLGRQPELLDQPTERVPVGSRASW
jgi:predicted transglutaminase-like cysteine proteinase